MLPTQPPGPCEDLVHHDRSPHAGRIANSTASEGVAACATCAAAGCFGSSAPCVTVSPKCWTRDRSTALPRSERTFLRHSRWIKILSQMSTHLGAQVRRHGGLAGRHFGTRSRWPANRRDERWRVFRRVQFGSARKLGSSHRKRRLRRLGGLGPSHRTGLERHDSIRIPIRARAATGPHSYAAVPPRRGTLRSHYETGSRAGAEGAFAGGRTGPSFAPPVLVLRQPF